MLILIFKGVRRTAPLPDISIKELVMEKSGNETWKKMGMKHGKKWELSYTGMIIR